MSFTLVSTQTVDSLKKERNIKVRLIVAVSRNDAIGKDGGSGLPWRCREDMRSFSLLTTGHTVLMGRKTAEAIGKPLKNRQNLMMTRGMYIPFSGIVPVKDFETALRLTPEHTDLFICGGAEIYTQAFQHPTLVDVVHLTRILEVVDDATTFLPRPWGFKGLTKTTTPLTRDPGDDCNAIYSEIERFDPAIHLEEL